MRLSSNQLSLILLAICWAVLYGPVYFEFSGNAWSRPENAHAPFLLALVGGVLFRQLRRVTFSENHPLPRLTIAALAILASAFYLPGRINDVELFVSFSQIPMLALFLLVSGGWRLVWRGWFALLMMLYLVVWPGWLINTLTGPLKLWISDMAAKVLSTAGLHVASSGVVLAAGPYELLIADACAGLNSLIALTSLGAIYLYMVRSGGMTRNIVIFLSLIPIAIFANLARVILLVLITYFGGYDAGQIFLHDFAGLFLFALSLLLLFALDQIWRPKRKLPSGQAAVA